MEVEVGHLRKRGLFSQRPGDGKVCLDPGKSCPNLHLFRRKLGFREEGHVSKFTQPVKS